MLRLIPYRCRFLVLAFAVATLLPTTLEAQPTRRGAPSGDARKVAIERSWWNQTDKIERLNLTAEQRQKMDQKLNEYFESRSEVDRTAKIQEFREALQAGDVDGARSLIEPTARAYNAPMIEQMTLSVDVVSLLEPEQLKALNETFPKLLTGPWVRMMRMDGRAGRPIQDN